MRLIGLDHVVLRSANAEKLVDFYVNVLGCREERRIDASIRLVQLRAGASLIDILAIDEARTRAHNMDHFCLRVDDFEPDEIRARLSAAGCSPEAPARRYGADGFGPSIYFRDPDGNLVELKGPPDKDGG
jgi:catechol 2,3-dioxygenase-like lactoylglutathione lyase family enzyme